MWDVNRRQFRVAKVPLMYETRTSRLVDYFRLDLGRMFPAVLSLLCDYEYELPVRLFFYNKR